MLCCWGLQSTLQQLNHLRSSMHVTVLELHSICVGPFICRLFSCLLVITVDCFGDVLDQLAPNTFYIISNLISLHFIRSICAFVVVLLLQSSSVVVIFLPSQSPHCQSIQFPKFTRFLSSLPSPISSAFGLCFRSKTLTQLVQPLLSGSILFLIWKI